MPVYEYVAEDGTRVELIRPIADADAPVPDPESRGRAFRRVFSTFAARGAAQVGGSGSPSAEGCCPCGKGKGSCSSS